MDTRKIDHYAANYRFGNSLLGTITETINNIIKTETINSMQILSAYPSYCIQIPIIIDIVKILVKTESISLCRLCEQLPGEIGKIYLIKLLYILEVNDIICINHSDTLTEWLIAEAGSCRIDDNFYMKDTYNFIISLKKKI